MSAQNRGDWRHIDDDECRRAAHVLELVGRRWAGAILVAIARGAHRFREIAATVEGLSDRMLSLRLREFENVGLIERIVVPTTPVNIRYELTDRGDDLVRALQPIAHYAHKWEPPAGAKSSGKTGEADQ